MLMTYPFMVETPNLVNHLHRCQDPWPNVITVWQKTGSFRKNHLTNEPQSARLLSDVG
jgi:hypothetical protein